jgi:hypothetical protein
MSEPVLDIAATAASIADAIRTGQLDAAEALLDQLKAVDPHADFLTVFTVIILIQRRRARDALWMLDELGEERFAELRALCLHMLGDPTWEGIAHRVVDSHDAEPVARLAMRQLLDLEQPRAELAAADVK